MARFDKEEYFKNIDLLINVDKDMDTGEYIACCSELNLTYTARKKEDAIKKIKSLIIYYLTTAKEFGIHNDVLFQGLWDVNTNINMTCH